jgi:hypothetical protein
MINIKRNGRRISRNKKGEDMLVDFWSILVFAVVLLLFLILFILTKGDTKDNELGQRFSNIDLDYMLDSYAKSPSLADGYKTNGEMMVEDVLNNDFTNTKRSFELFFLGINTTNNNPIGSFNMVIAKSKIMQASFDVDPISEGYTAAKLYKGVAIITKYAKITLPNNNGEDIEVILTIEYVMMNEKPFE